MPKQKDSSDAELLWKWEMTLDGGRAAADDWLHNSVTPGKRLNKMTKEMRVSAGAVGGEARCCCDGRESLPSLFCTGRAMRRHLCLRGTSNGSARGTAASWR